MSPTARLGLIGVLFLSILGTLWWTMTETESPYPESRSVEGLGDSVVVEWTQDGAARIETVDSTDFFSALGYVHGMNRSWTMTLWRQTAQGELSRWFGTHVVSLDQHVRRLGLERQSRQAYESLPPSEKEPLRAYAKGVNAAFQSSAVRNASPFLLLDIQPKAWAPWHALLIERLMAWMATPLLSPPSGAPNAVDQFCETDRKLRRWLHLHGWKRSVAWAVRPANSSSSPTLFQRHVLGATAVPTVQEIEWSQSNNTRLTAATLPGGLLLPTGRTPAASWASLLRSPASLRRIALDSSAVTAWKERIDPTGGDEHLLRIRWQDDALILAPSTVAPQGTSDSTTTQTSMAHWVVDWPGLTARSDVTAWLRRAGLTTPSRDSTGFQLVEPDGLRVTDNGNWSVLGSPSVVRRDPTGSMVLVGQSHWARHQANGLEALIQDGKTPAVGSWSTADSSTWAADLLPHLQQALDSVGKSNNRLDNATTYVRNWDHHYSATSIGAALFDQWMRSYRTELGHIPELADTAAYFASYRQQRALRRAVDTLTNTLGPDVRRWRWDRIVSDNRYFPVWSADSIVNRDLETMRTTRYAPLTRTARGHPSVPGGGPSRVDPNPMGPAPTRWEGWFQSGGPFTVRRHHYDPSSTFARSRLLRTRPSATAPLTGDAEHSTTLVPAQP